MTYRKTGRERLTTCLVHAGHGAGRIVYTMSLAVGITLALSLPCSVLVGCKKKKAAPPPVVAPPPPPPPTPDPIQVDSVLQSMKPDARVEFPQSHAPVDESLARAIIEFQNALVKGDAAKFKAMLDPSSRDILDALTGSGDWEEATGKIEGVRVISLSEVPGDSLPSVGASVQIAIQQPRVAYALPWAVTRNGDSWSFSGVGSQLETRPRASDFDGGAPIASAPESGGRTSAGSGITIAGQSAVITYINMEIGKRLLRFAGMPEPSLDASIAQISRQLGVDAAEVQAAISAGKQAVDAGTEPTPEEVATCVAVWTAAGPAMGISVTQDQVLQHIANITRIPENKVRELFNRGGSGGGVPFTPPRGRGGG